MTAAILLAAALLDSSAVTVFTRLPDWAADVTDVPSRHLAWGCGGNGEFLRLTVTNYAGICSCVDGFYERRLVGKDYALDWMTWTNATETATNVVTTRIHETPTNFWATAPITMDGPPVGINDGWDLGEARQFADTMRLVSYRDILAVRDGLATPGANSMASGLAVGFCGPALRSAIGDDLPPLDPSGPGGTPRYDLTYPDINFLATNSWAGTFPVYGRLDADPFVWRSLQRWSVGDCGFLRRHPWQNDYIQAGVGAVFDFWRDHPAVEGVNLTNAVRAATGNPWETVNDLLSAYTNDTLRLLWPRSGCIDVIEGDLTETYRAQQLLTQRVDDNAVITRERTGTVEIRIDWTAMPPTGYATNLCFTSWGAATTNAWSSGAMNPQPIVFAGASDTNVISEIDCHESLMSWQLDYDVLFRFTEPFAFSGAGIPPTWPDAWVNALTNAPFGYDTPRGNWGRVCPIEITFADVACSDEGYVSMVSDLWSLTNGVWGATNIVTGAYALPMVHVTVTNAPWLAGRVQAGAATSFSEIRADTVSDLVMSNLYALGYAVSNVTDSVAYGISGGETALDPTPGGEHWGPFPEPRTWDWYVLNRPDLLPAYQDLWLPMTRLRADTYGKWRGNRETILSNAIEQVGRVFARQTGRTRWATSWVSMDGYDLADAPSRLDVEIKPGLIPNGPNWRMFCDAHLVQEWDGQAWRWGIDLAWMHCQAYRPFSSEAYDSDAPYLPFRIDWTVGASWRREYASPNPKPRHETWADLYEQTRTAFKWHNIRRPQ